MANIPIAKERAYVVEADEIPREEVVARIEATVGFLLSALVNGRDPFFACVSREADNSVEIRHGRRRFVCWASAEVDFADGTDSANGRTRPKMRSAAQLRSKIRLWNERVRRSLRGRQVPAFVWSLCRLRRLLFRRWAAKKYESDDRSIAQPVSFSTPSALCSDNANRQHRENCSIC